MVMASPVLCRLVCIVFLLTVPSGAVRTDRGKHGHDALAASSEMKHAGASQVGYDFCAPSPNNQGI